MTEEMIESMCLVENETEMYVQRFQANLDRRVKAYEESSQPKDNKTFYYVIRGTLYDTFKFDVFVTAFFAFMGEFSAIAYSMFLKVLVDYLKDDEAPIYMGVIYVLIFGLLMLCSSICRN